MGGPKPCWTKLNQIELQQIENVPGSCFTCHMCVDHTITDNHGMASVCNLQLAETGESQKSHLKCAELAVHGGSFQGARYVLNERAYRVFGSIPRCSYAKA